MAKDRYLLYADKDDMDRWRQDARDQGISFAAHIRHCLDRVTAYPERQSWPEETKAAFDAAIDANRPKIAKGLGKKSYKADPK